MTFSLIIVVHKYLPKSVFDGTGNVFVVNMALADLAVTGLAIPAATIGLLANLSDWNTICQIQWHCLLLTCFVSAPSAAAAAADARLQIAIGPDRYLYAPTLPLSKKYIYLKILWFDRCGILTLNRRLGRTSTGKIWLILNDLHVNCAVFKVPRGFYKPMKLLAPSNVPHRSLWKLDIR